jgi:hypothetical protein
MFDDAWGNTKRLVQSAKRDTASGFWLADGLRTEREEMRQIRSIVATAGIVALLMTSAAAQTAPAGQGDAPAATNVTVPVGSLQRA